MFSQYSSCIFCHTFTWLNATFSSPGTWICRALVFAWSFGVANLIGFCLQAYLMIYELWITLFAGKHYLYYIWKMRFIAKQNLTLFYKVCNHFPTKIIHLTTQLKIWLKNAPNKGHSIFKLFTVHFFGLYLSFPFELL